MAIAPSFYVASTVVNREKAQHFIEQLRARGWFCTYDWTKHGSVMAADRAVQQRVAEDELHGVREADHFILLFPGGRGSHLELGVALATKPRRSISLIGSKAERGDFCTFHELPGIHQFDTQAGFWRHFFPSFSHR